MTNNTINTTGPDFISIQVRDIAVSGAFYEQVVGLSRVPAPNPAAVVFTSGSISFAVRTPMPGIDLDAIKSLGAGIGVWFHHDDPGSVYQRLLAYGATIVQKPAESPFGPTFVFLDPDGYTITVHGNAR